MVRQILYDSAADIFDGSEPWENSAGGRQEMTSSNPSPAAPLVSLIRDMETNGGGGGGVKLGLHVVPHTFQLVLESCSILKTSWM